MKFLPQWMMLPEAMFKRATSSINGEHTMIRQFGKVLDSFRITLEGSGNINS
jgi:hypothetical protein